MINACRFRRNPNICLLNTIIDCLLVRIQVVHDRCFLLLGRGFAKIRRFMMICCQIIVCSRILIKC
ncbi:uncharacterized protein B0P05DRAFT_520947 [Gilbertella persicaria]|uniref:uncharacterized protein n=1 Tax=Gilbertella persicaria TaxID=101096 RepID=UPI00222115DA|nr:uncharacterized protein B0P05DRAFT_520947 [Gilbertella persicaria]KAI8098221.1 hypothetical protein B0P05DRAFT_520947 [Gilbertella persicaria]